MFRSAAVMRNAPAKYLFGVLALLASSIVSAATVTVTPSVTNLVSPGTNFFVTVGSADMSVTTGATLGVTFDPTVIAIGTAVPIAPNFNFAVYTPTGSGTGLVSVISTSALGVAGPFNAFKLNLTALHLPPGASASANLVFVDDGLDLGWSDTQANLITGVHYQQANIIGDDGCSWDNSCPSRTPAPPAVWLLGTGLAGLGGRRWLRRKMSS